MEMILEKKGTTYSMPRVDSRAGQLPSLIHQSSPQRSQRDEEQQAVNQHNGS